MSEMDEFILQTLAEHDFCLRDIFLSVTEKQIKELKNQKKTQKLGCWQIQW